MGTQEKLFLVHNWFEFRYRLCLDRGQVLHDLVKFLLRGKVPVKEIGHVEKGSGIEVPQYGVSFKGYY